MLTLATDSRNRAGELRAPIPVRYPDAAAYAWNGQFDDTEVLALDPDFTIARERKAAFYKRPEDFERYLAGLRRAGLPEG